MASWQLQQAKARLSELLKKAAVEGPQQITVRGEPTAIVVTDSQYRRLKRPAARFLDFMRGSPLLGTDLEFERQQTLTRSADVT